MHPRLRRGRRDEVLGPIVVAAWSAAVVLALAGLLTPSDRGYGFVFASYGALALFAAIGGWWLTSSGRYILRGSSVSIRTAIPRTARKSVGRQLALRQPLDPEHADVVLELAHQGRDLIGGQVALYAFYVPLFVNIARSSHDVIGLGILGVGAVAFIIGGVLLALTGKRLTVLVRSHEDGAPSTGHSTTA